MEIKGIESHQDHVQSISDGNIGRQKDVSGDSTNYRLSKPTYPTQRYRREFDQSTGTMGIWQQR
jgi:hypothetical protein